MSIVLNQFFFHLIYSHFILISQVLKGRTDFYHLFFAEFLLRKCFQLFTVRSTGFELDFEPIPKLALYVLRAAKAPKFASLHHNSHLGAQRL